MAEEKPVIPEQEPTEGLEGKETEEPKEKEGVNIDELAAQIEQLKKLQAGSDKAYQTAAAKLKAIEEENEKLKKESMSEKERAEFELEKRKKELEEKDREVKTERANFYRMKVVGEKNLPVEVAEFIHGETEADIIASADKLLAGMEKYAHVKVSEAMGTVSKPAAGSGDGPTSKDIKNMSLQEVEKLAREGKL
jgi:hypothetical protein